MGLQILAQRVSDPDVVWSGHTSEIDEAANTAEAADATAVVPDRRRYQRRQRQFAGRRGATADDRCSYLLIDRAAKEMVVIDPHRSQPSIGTTRCQHYRVPAVLSTAAEECADAAALLRDMLPLTSGDNVFLAGQRQRLPVRCHPGMSERC